ncbi:MAG TPA: response regulator transcription factor [Ktedonobacteraceae bacterium]|nr:response regulator transcription factor [Ktedonobacteraceae bacterium]
MKLLIVDSDRYWNEMLTSWLKTMGFEVRRAYTVEQARLEWIEQQPDLVILDPAFKDADGLILCRQLQAKHDALVLITTADKGVEDEIRCLESGVDDYLRKPFFPGQLLARIRTLSRRGRSTLKQRPASILTIGPLQVDSLHNTASISGKTTHLTPIQSKLLHFLAINVNQVCTADQIVSYVWGYQGDATLIKAHIHQLRLKIEPDPAHPRFIHTVPGVGYKLTYVPAASALAC